MDESGAVGIDRLVLLAVAYCQDQGMETVPLSTVQARAGLSLRATQEHVALLADAGTLVRVEGGGRGEQTRVWLETPHTAQGLRKNHAHGAGFTQKDVVNHAHRAGFPVNAGTPPSPLPASLPPSPPIPSPLPIPSPGEGDTPEELRSSAPTPRYTAEFERWWQACPPRMRRCGKGEAYGVWTKKNGARPPLAELLDTLALQAASYDWTKDDGQYVPMATTYLNKSRWEAEVQPAPRGSPNGDRAAPVTFEQQKQRNNEAAFEEVRRLVEGSQTRGVPEIRGPDEAPRRRLPG